MKKACKGLIYNKKERKMWNWKEWVKAALIRAIKTFAQTFGSCIMVGAAASEIDWARALSVSGVAAVLSIATSLAGLPEVEKTDPPDGYQEEFFVGGQNGGQKIF